MNSCAYVITICYKASAIIKFTYCLLTNVYNGQKYAVNYKIEYDEQRKGSKSVFDGQPRKKISLTGYRTPAAPVRAPNPNH